MKRRPGNCRDPLGEVALDEHGLAVEDVDLGIDVLAVHQERHADLLHPLQHVHDLAIVGDARGRVGGGIGGIELHAGEHAVLEAALDVVGIGVVGEIAGHQRLEGRALRQRRHDALAIGDGVLGGGDRRNEIGHQDGAAEMPGGERHHRLEHGAVAHVQVPVVGLADGDARGHRCLARHPGCHARESGHRVHAEPARCASGAQTPSSVITGSSAFADDDTRAHRRVRRLS